MKAIILAAGSGKRLNLNLPKSLVKINGETILNHQVKILKKYVDEIIVVSGFKHELVEKQCKKLKVKVVYNPFFFTENIVSLCCAINYFNDEILIINGDVLFSESIIKKLVKEEGNILVVERWIGTQETDDQLFYHEYDEEAMKVELDNLGHFKRLSKKIGRWESFGEYTGIAKISSVKCLTETLKEIIKKGKVNNWYEYAFNLMINKGEKFICKLVEVNDYWFEIDNDEDLRVVKIWFKK